MRSLSVVVLPVVLFVTGCGESEPTSPNDPALGASQTAPTLPPPGTPPTPAGATIPADTVTCAGKFASVKLNVVSDANGAPARVAAELTGKKGQICAPVTSTWSARLDAPIVRIDRSPERVVLVLGDAPAQASVDTTILSAEEQASADCAGKAPPSHEERAIPIASLTLVADTVGKVSILPTDGTGDLGTECVEPDMVSGLRGLVSALLQR
jgi:hypothetical protein